MMECFFFSFWYAPSSQPIKIPGNVLRNHSVETNAWKKIIFVIPTFSFN